MLLHKQAAIENRFIEFSLRSNLPRNYTAIHFIPQTLFKVHIVSLRSTAR